jgi:hypothetical protein
MKNLILGAFLVVTASVNATTPTLTSITQPLYYLGSAGDAEIQLIEVPKILNNSSAMFWIGLFSDPTEVRGSDGDLNLISLYGISVEMTHEDDSGKVKAITIDATKAKQPDRYPLSVNSVIEAAVKAVRMEFPDAAVTEITVKAGAAGSNETENQGEQGGAGQPATRSESDLEGGDKPQPESEGRSR